MYRQDHPSGIFKGTETDTSENKLDSVNITSRLLNLIFEMTLAEKLELLDHLDNSDNHRGRKHARRPWITPINYRAENQVFQNVIKNISAGGVFIETRMPLAVGQDITMMFRLPKSRKLIQASGEIVRSDPRGIGVKFKRQQQKR